MNPDQRFSQLAATLGYSFDGEIKIGGNYLPLKSSGTQIFISGQIPRVGDTVIVTGRLGQNLDLSQGQLAAKICVKRALALLQRHLGTLDAVKEILKINVFVQCAENFTQHSEVAYGASDVLCQVLGPAGPHTRTSVGAFQLPQNTAVELDMVAVAHPSTN